MPWGLPMGPLEPRKETKLPDAIDINQATGPESNEWRSDMRKRQHGCHVSREGAAMRWTLAKDGLPKHGQRTLFWTPDSWLVQIGIFDCCNTKGDRWLDCDGDIHYDVTHWIPLPEPPEGAA